MLELEQFMPYRLSVLSNRVSQGIAQTYQSRFGLSVTEWRVIALIGRYPGLSASEVAKRSAMDKVAISRAVRNLLDQGRIEREASPDDRRTRHLTLSASGLDIYEQIVPAALAYQKQLLSALTPEELTQFDRLVQRLSGRAVELIDDETDG
ncbi:MAG: MarR family transcriptional regulator [Pseudomonadota bacterium]